MQYEENQNIHGFRITRIRYSSELNGELVEMKHIGTGARLAWLNNGAENKVFSIAFRTLPDDNTGVFHILEHSVLCGSEKYPVREPFVELLKGSMNTFLNAMTFPDMTMYPVASRNDRDLLNLTQVYLDAVFHPSILHDERIFCQEGWHIELEGNKKYIYKGVVLNEMKGAMSDVSETGEREVSRQLFPDTGYGYNSGGDPEWIPSLTYDKFLETYHRHYHPSNCWIYLDGEVPAEEMLSLIDEYLRPYQHEDDLPKFRMQTPVSSKREILFELGQEEDPVNRGHLYLSRIFGSWKDKTRNMAAGIVGDVLTGTNDAPLKRLILEKGLAQNFTLSVDDSALQAVLTMHAENITDGKEKEILETISEFAEKLELNGMDPAALEASLNRMVFSLKEEDEPQGIDRAVRIMGSWLYDGDPIFQLENDAQIAELRRMVNDGSFNKLACSMLQEQYGLCFLSMKPSKELGEQKRKDEEKRLEIITSCWTDAERDKNEKLISSLKAWQETPDSPDALASLPMLKKEEADIPPEWPETEEKWKEEVPVLFHRQPTGGIIYLRAYFKLTGLNRNELMDMSLICGLLGKLPTEKHNSAALQQEIKMITGRLSFSVGVLGNYKDSTKCIPCLTAGVSVMKENLARAEELLVEILKTTDFSASDKIHEIVLQLEMNSRQRIVGAGHIIGIRNVLSHYSSEMALKNALEGDLAVKYLHSLAEKPAEKMPDILKTAEKLKNGIICRKRLSISVTADNEASPDYLLMNLPEGKSAPDYSSFRADAKPYQGYRIPAQVGFAARGFRLSEVGLTFRGEYLLLANILTYSWLWNQVRVQGGAYGCGFQVDRAGNIVTYSFRDPTPNRTLRVDESSSSFLREFLKGGENLDKYIISTLNDLNPLLSAREKGMVADLRYFTGYTREEAEKIRKEILHATPETLSACTDILEKFVERGSVCVVAPGELLDKCEKLSNDDL